MTHDFWIVVAGIIFGAVVAAFGLLLFFTYKFRQSVAAILKKPAALEIINLLKKVTWRDYFESNIRAQTGKPLKRPFGTNTHFFQWDRFQLNPVYLSRKPLSGNIQVKTEVIIGPQAKKPLILKAPLLISAMAYGNAISFKAKMALAKASTLTGTADNTGGGPLVEEARACADKYIIQFHRGFWSRSEEILRQADMIEITLGHGAWDSAPVRLSGQEITDGFARRLGTIPGLDVMLESRLPEVENVTDWKNLILKLKEITGGVPIGVKLGGTHYIETELDFITQGEIDVLVLDGAEGGTHACPTILQDDVGLPTLLTLCRAVKYLENHNLKGKISLIISGGLVTPGDFLKCLALGADVVSVGTIAALAMAHTQLTKATPWEPPTGIIYYGAKEEQKFNPDLAAKHLANFYEGCIREMQLAAHSLGKNDLRDINKTDLVTLDPEYAKITGVQYLYN